MKLKLKICVTTGSGSVLELERMVLELGLSLGGYMTHVQNRSDVVGSVRFFYCHKISLKILLLLVKLINGHLCSEIVN